MERNILGRIRTEVEQACTRLPPAARLRIDDQLAQVLKDIGGVCDVPAERTGA